VEIGASSIFSFVIIIAAVVVVAAVVIVAVVVIVVEDIIKTGAHCFLQLFYDALIRCGDYSPSRSTSNTLNVVITDVLLVANNQTKFEVEEPGVFWIIRASRGRPK